MENLIYHHFNKLKQLCKFIKESLKNENELTFFDNSICKLQFLIHKYCNVIFFDLNQSSITISNGFHDLILNVLLLLESNNKITSPKTNYIFNFSNVTILQLVYKECLEQVETTIKPYYENNLLKRRSEIIKKRILKQSLDVIQYICKEKKFKLDNEKNYFNFEVNMFNRVVPYKNIFF